MRFNGSKKDQTYDDFKKVVGKFFENVPEKTREKAIIREWENMTGKKHDPKRTPKKVKRVSKSVAEDQEPGA